MSSFQEKRIRKLQERERKLISKLAEAQMMIDRNPWQRKISDMELRAMKVRAAECALAMNEMGLDSELEWTINVLVEEIHDS